MKYVTLLLMTGRPTTKEEVLHSIAYRDGHSHRVKSVSGPFVSQDEAKKYGETLTELTGAESLVMPISEPLGGLEPADECSVTITRDQLESWVGRPLTDDEVERIDTAIPHSSIPEAVATIAGHLHR